MLAGLIIDALFLVWENYYGGSRLTADVPALLVGVVSVLSVVAEAMLPSADIVRVLLFSRMFLLAQSFWLVIFAVWLLSREAGLPLQSPTFIHYWQRFGEVVPVFALILLTLIAARRVFKGIRTFDRVVDRPTNR